jgi:hypothetical protein
MWGYAAIRRLRCEATRSYEPAWDSWAVECGMRIHAEVKVKRSSESKGYALPEGQQKRMLINGVRVVTRTCTSRRIKRRSLRRS